MAIKNGNRGSARWCVVVLSVFVAGGCAVRAPTNVSAAPVTSAAGPTPVSSSGVEAARIASAAAAARPGDRDGDGWRDEDDFCPDAAEDRDDCNDEDGCPDPDDDGDGVLDAVDKCPTEHDRHSGRDGCPARLPTKTVIFESSDDCFIMMEPIDFAKNEATIGVLGGDILDHIAEHFRRCNIIVTLEIRGKKGVNEKPPDLAAERAEAVRAALVARGVEARRLRVVTDGVVAEPVPINKRRFRAVHFIVSRSLSCGQR